MRTDAKIGFAIGGVLLCVLTVYAIVVPRHKKTTNATVSLVTPVAQPSPSDSSSGLPPQMGAPDSPANASTPSALSTSTPPAFPLPAPAKEGVASTPSSPAGPLADATPGSITPNLLQDAKNLTKPEEGDLHGDVYLPPGKSKASHVHPATPQDDTPSPSPSDRTYTIKPGQTLSKIAYEVYGNSRYWVAIQRENRGLDSNHLKIGSKINLPDISPPGPITVADEQTPDTTASSLAPVETPSRHKASGSSEGHTYIVKSGDSLYGIAKRLLGSGRKAESLYALNKDIIGPDKSRLKLGMVLKLPESARATSATASLAE